jgi:hypothetical protein
MHRVIEVDAALRDGAICCDRGASDLARMVLDEKQIVILKGVFPERTLLDVRRAVFRWGQQTPLLSEDDFAGNYHRQRAMVSRLHSWPHVFHDFNFNELDALEKGLREAILAIFEPLRILYNELTGDDIQFGIPPAGPYLHPQFIQYPKGGGFFARHWHDLVPQRIGFIVSMSRYGRDYRGGGTAFEVEGEVVDIEGVHDIGDICLWRFDYHHWVKQSDLKDQFDWGADDGRWVATFPYYDPRRWGGEETRSGNA